jgi:sarcosine oxidase subunit beta
LLGGTFSPEDGSASPLKTAAAFYKHAKASGAEFHFNEKVSQVTLANGRVNQIITRVLKNKFRIDPSEEM